MSKTLKVMLLFLLLGLLLVRQLWRPFFRPAPKRWAWAGSLLCFLLLVSFSSSSQAQSMPRTVVGSSGEYLDNLLFGTLNFTVGEVAVKRYETSISLAEGFHRTYYDLIVSSEDLSPIDWAVEVFPNPATEYLKVRFPSTESLIHAQLFGTTGQLLLEQEDLTSETELDLSQLPAGTYWLRLLDEQGQHASFQVQKVVR